MSKADKSLVYGPQPAPRPTLTEDHQRPYHSNPTAPSQGDPAGNPNRRRQLAQGQYISPSRVPGHGVDALAHLEHGAPPAQHAVTLTATAAHPECATYQGVGGRPPEVTVMSVNAAEAATAIGRPSDFRAVPRGAEGIAGRGPQRPAPLSPGHEPFTTPARPGGPAATPFDRMGGQLQGHSPDVGPPGWQFSSRAPNDGQSRFGRGNPAA